MGESREQGRHGSQGVACSPHRARGARQDARGPSRRGGEAGARSHQDAREREAQGREAQGGCGGVEGEHVSSVLPKGLPIDILEV